MGNQTKDVVRYERYKKVLGVLVAREVFSLDDVKDACRDEKPVFVTKVANQLKGDGYVVRNGPKTKPSFQWAQSPDAFNATQWLDQQIYGSQITQTPANDRPRERLLAHGAPELRTAELIAILIRSGRPGESALQGGESVANRFDQQLERLPRAGRAEMKSISKAIDVTTYCQIMAGIELGRRVRDASEEAGEPEIITGSNDAIAICQRRFARLAEDGCQEEFHIVTLDTKNKVIDTPDLDWHTRCQPGSSA